MSINLILLLAANGVRLTNSPPRFIETLSAGKPINVLDQERNQFSLTVVDRQVQLDAMPSDKSAELTIIRTQIEPAQITTADGDKLRLRPVPMKAKPSDCPEAWLRFQGSHIAGTQLNEIEQKRLQNYMGRYCTDAVTDGLRLMTFAGDMLAQFFIQEDSDPNPAI